MPKTEELKTILKAAEVIAKYSPDDEGLAFMMKKLERAIELDEKFDEINCKVNPSANDILSLITGLKELMEMKNG